jgi:hypothetical protein
MKWKVPWRVAELRVLEPYRLFVRFVDGTAGEVEMRRLVHSKDAGVFEALRDRAEFAAAYLDLGVVTWPSGVDLAPDAMYDEIKAHGRWVLD